MHMSVPDLLAVVAAEAGATRLSNWGLIRARGADAARFLQGQLTADIEHLGKGQAQLAGYCSAKGRLLASFVVWQQGQDWMLACSADLLPAVLKRLSMFVLRAQCQLSDESTEWGLWGAVGSMAATVSAWQTQTDDAGTWIGLPAVGGMARALRVQALNAAPLQTTLPKSAWDWLEVVSGVPRINQATMELFVPQMVNFELVGGVNFKKGCYPGQEVVARSQYRGTLKRRGAILQGDTAAQAGQEIYSSLDPEQPAGSVAMAASHSGGHLCFAELKLAALDGGTLHLGQVNGPLLHACALPYAIPADDR